MSEEKFLDQVEWTTAMSEQDVKDVSEGNLIPGGKWPGILLTDVMVSEADNEESPMYGQTVARCHALLTVNDEQKHFFFTVCPVVVKATSKTGGTYIREESKNAAAVYAATGMAGSPIQDVLKHMMEKEYLYDITVKAASGNFPASNRLKGIRRVE